MTISPQTAGVTQARFDRLQRSALIAGGIGLLLAIVGALFDLDQFLQSYLFAYLFWLGISLGCLAWLLVQYIASGGWGVVIRPFLESSALLVGLMALLFIPLLLGLDRLYAWTSPEAVANDALLAHKRTYLNAPFFMGRALLYFVVWGGSVWLISRWALAREETGAPALVDRLRRFSAPAFAAYGLSVTFASFDWLMSLDPHWFSTIFGVLVAAGQAVAGLAFVITVLAYLVDAEPLARFVSRQHWLDLGNLLFAAMLFWSYIAFMQFFIIWSGNLPEEVLWYLHRLEGGWQWLAIALVVLHFAVPFALLLSGQVKRNPRRLAGVALLLLAAQLLHLYWMVAPAFSAADFRLHWLDIVMPVMLGGLWLAAFVWALRRRPLVRTQDLPPQQEVYVHE